MSRELALGHRSDVTGERIAQVLRDRLGSRYKVTHGGARGADVLVRRNAWTGARVRVKRRNGDTALVVHGLVPNPFARFADIVLLGFMTHISDERMSPQIAAALEAELLSEGVARDGGDGGDGERL